MTEHGLAVSIVIATRNRCAALALTLDALTRLEAPGELAWEVVVVDNGSTDETSSLLATFAARLPLTVVFEPVPGLSVARNTGIRTARGAVIAFTDDDCIVDAQWLARLWEEFERDQDLAGLGGRVELHDPRDWPVTIRTSRQRATFTSPLQLSALIAGCNMAFARRTIEAVGDFDTTLGAGTRVSAGEDLDFIYRAFRKKLKIVYAPEAVVYHNHGRRTAEQVARLRRNYTYGRGALFCKYLLRADRGMALRATHDVLSHAREAARDIVKLRFPQRTVRHYWYMAIGAAAWLVARPRTGMAASLGGAHLTPASAHSSAPTESSRTPLRSPS